MTVDRTFFNSANIDILPKKILHGFADILDAIFTGVAGGSNASAGQIGEVMSASVAAIATGLTSGSPLNVASVTLTPGDWDVRGSYVLSGTGSTTFTVANCGFNTVSATLPASNLYNTRNSSTFTPPNNIYASAEVPSQRINVSAATTIYLVAQATFAASTAGAGGTITARRMR